MAGEVPMPNRTRLKTIAYLLYGSRPEYQLELTYSVLSAMHFLRRDRSDYRIALITDEANRRLDLPVEHLIFSSDEFRRWTRHETYMHEAKVHALMKAIDHFKSAVVLLDTDTCFLNHPEMLFQRVSAGKSVMHSSEGSLERFGSWNPLLERVTEPVAGYRVSRASEMRNSGVVGVDFSDRHVLDEAVLLIGELHGIYPIFNIEQFAFTAVLNKHTQVGDCSDIVQHYYGYERPFFHSQIGQLFPMFSAELFDRYVGDLPRLGYPRKRRSDQLKAMLISSLRRHGNDYRFAYYAYLCALGQSAANAPDASIWAHIALKSLRNNRFPVEHIERDFGKMKHAHDYQWLTSETKQEWILYWESIGVS
jgi:hypothetical protein